VIPRFPASLEDPALDDGQVGTAVCHGAHEKLNGLGFLDCQLGHRRDADIKETGEGGRANATDLAQFGPLFDVPQCLRAESCFPLKSLESPIAAAGTHKLVASAYASCLEALNLVRGESGQRRNLH
jgi:hypothetical protein